MKLIFSIINNWLIHINKYQNEKDKKRTFIRQVEKYFKIDNLQKSLCMISSYT